jgi:hypothetical protein
MAGFECFGTIATNPNSNLEEASSRLNSENACYHSVKKLTSSSLKKYTDILTVILRVLYGWESVSVTVREKHRLRSLSTEC